MSDTNGGYSLRRGFSPHRKAIISTSSLRRKKKNSSPGDEQDEYDGIFVATYNDSPKHLYGISLSIYSIYSI